MVIENIEEKIKDFKSMADYVEHLQVMKDNMILK